MTFPQSLADSERPSPGQPSTNYLPQYGFGSEDAFDRLVQDNPFLFRVYTPKTRSQRFSTSEAYFVGQKYNEHFTHAAEQLESPAVGPGETVASISSYQDAALHMDWTQRHKSPFISTTFSFIWAIWEAARRYRVGLKHDVEIAIIDSRMLAGRAATALELLRKGTPKERHLDYWKWYRYALESQNVLVHGSIPAPAVLASVPLLSLIDKLPSYFLGGNCDEKILSPFDALSWDTMDRKPSFRKFCYDMSNQFLRLPTEHRLRDATGGSVRLAMAFLRPWFHKALSHDIANATDTACSLAFMIAQWPAQWWSRDHVEMWSVIRSLVQAVAEEVREKQQSEATDEVRRLQDVVTGLERVVQDYEEAEVASCVYPETETEDDDFTIVLPPSPPASVCGRRSPTPMALTGAIPAPTAPVTTSESAVTNPHSEPKETSPPTPEIPIDSPPITPELNEDKKEEQSSSPNPLPSDSEEPPAQSHSFVETASCIITGILVGAFITLCIVNSTRRTLIYVT
ncbi:hypothetical protein ID866_2083 [Astraeus odoratus]|nr:hypothetical protein ID866_2083 [Astraeus odoratus]